MAATIQDINREILSHMHPDLLIQIVLIPVEIELLLEIRRPEIITINMQEGDRPNYLNHQAIQKQQQ